MHCTDVNVHASVISNLYVYTKLDKLPKYNSSIQVFKVFSSFSVQLNHLTYDV